MKSVGLKEDEIKAEERNSKSGKERKKEEINVFMTQAGWNKKSRFVEKREG
jgi:hypothetical protein